MAFWAARASRQAATVFSSSCFTAAKTHLLKALELDPQHALAHGTLGGLYDRLELDFPKAMQAYTKAERLHVDWLPWKQDTLLNAGLYESGLECTQQMEASNPLHPEPKLYTGRFLLRLGRVEEGSRKMEEALAIQNDWPIVIGNAFGIQPTLVKVDTIRSVVEQSVVF